MSKIRIFRSRHKRRFGYRLYSKKKRERERSQRARVKAFTKASRSRSARASQGETNVSQGQGQPPPPHFLRRLEKKERARAASPLCWGVQGPRSAGARVHTKPPPPPKKKNRGKVRRVIPNTTPPPPTHPTKTCQGQPSDARGSAKKPFFPPKNPPTLGLHARTHRLLTHTRVIGLHSLT